MMSVIHKKLVLSLFLLAKDLSSLYLRKIRNVNPVRRLRPSNGMAHTGH